MLAELALLAGTSLRPDDIESIAVEWRPECPLVIGGKITEDGDLYGYAGVRADFDIGAWRITPAVAAGVYDAEVDGRKEAESLQFTARLEVTREISERWRFGVAVDHMSNAGTEDPNENAESVSVVMIWR